MLERGAQLSFKLRIMLQSYLKALIIRAHGPMIHPSNDKINTESRLSEGEKEKRREKGV